METFDEQIKTICCTLSIDELNLCHLAVAAAISQTAEDCGNRDFERDMMNSLNLVANYNIVRIANAAYNEFEKKPESSHIETLDTCIASIKPHADNGVEKSLLSDLRSRMDRTLRK